VKGILNPSGVLESESINGVCACILSKNSVNAQKIKNNIFVFFYFLVSYYFRIVYLSVVSESTSNGTNA
jgi:hypothetical protein